VVKEMACCLVIVVKEVACCLVIVVKEVAPTLHPAEWMKRNC